VIELLVAVCGASGLVLMVSGVPLLRRGRLAARVEPYLSGLRGKPSTLLAPAGAGNNLIRRLGSRLIRADQERDLARRLDAAGGHERVADFRVRQLTWGLSAGAAGPWFLFLVSGTARIGLQLQAIPVLATIAFACGWFGCDWWLSRRIQERRTLLGEELPTAIDLVTLSILAGESVPAAFERVSSVMRAGIGHEFGRVVADIRAGAPVLDALESLKGRLPGHNIARFVDALVGGIERGSPLSDVLRAQADDVREARRRDLLELGGRKEVLMLLPVVFLIMPVVVIFALLPGLASLDLLIP
jgi:tight adherence protein C